MNIYNEDKLNKNDNLTNEIIKDGGAICSNTVDLVASLVFALASSDREQTQVPYFQHINHDIAIV